MNPRGKSPSAQRFGALLQAVRIRRLRPRDVSARKAGIEVRADAWVLGAQDEQVNSDLEKNSRYSVVILGPDVLGAKQGAVVPIVGHALSHVQDHRSGAHGRSRAATETKAYLTQIYVSQELEKAGLFCTDQSLLCQDEKLSLRIWKDDLEHKPLRKEEFNTQFHKGIDKANNAEKACYDAVNPAFTPAQRAIDAKSCQRGTQQRMAVIESVFGYLDKKPALPEDFTDAEKAAQKKHLKDLGKEDTTYRQQDNGKFVLPVIPPLKEKPKK